MSGPMALECPFFVDTVDSKSRAWPQTQNPSILHGTLFFRRRPERFRIPGLMLPGSQSDVGSWAFFGVVRVWGAVV